MLSWHRTHQGTALAGLGDQALLTRPMTAFFASRQCPGAAIRAAMDWALQQAKTRQVVIGGFHSPLEQSVLTVLLQARSSVVVVLARPVDSATLPPAWGEALAQGRMAVVSSATAAMRLTHEAAALRNAQVAQLATSIVVAHASPGGSLANLVAQWRREERQIAVLSDE
jgi:predicted Rossmann fold nucleotide-binding protein DprA/Smf involved in DNA uptake